MAIGKRMLKVRVWLILRLAQYTLLQERSPRELRVEVEVEIDSKCGLVGDSGREWECESRVEEKQVQ